MNEELILICALCSSSDISEQFSGDESWSVCGNCGAVEQGYDYVTDEEYEGLNL